MTASSEETRVQPVEVTCPGCFHPREWDAAGVCPICHYRANLLEGRSAALLPIGTQLKGYVIGEKLGQGGFGITYRGFDVTLKMKVAIKEYYPSEFVGRSTDRKVVVLNAREHEELFQYGLRTFLQEAQTIAQLRHPHLVRVLNFFELSDTAYLVMDYYEGEDLARHLKPPRKGQPGVRLPWRRAITLLLPVLSGLEKVHQAGFMHRDIKPGNLYLTRDDELILLDFGSARQVSGTHTRSLLIFSEGFAPYEQYLQGQLNRQGPWTDVYAVAATLYFMLTARRLPSGSVRQADVRSKRPDPLQPARSFVPALPPALDVVLGRALTVEPEQRLQSVLELKRQLEAVLAEESKKEKQAGTRTKSKPPQLNLRAAVIAGIVGILAWGGWWIEFGQSLELLHLKSKPIVVTPPVTTTPSAVETPPAVATPPVAASLPAVETPPIAATPPAVETSPIVETPSVAASLPAAPRTPASPVVAPTALSRSSFEPDLVRIPAGCFQMGSPRSETGWDEDERQHRVCVDAFEIGKDEVTVGEFRRFVEASGYRTDAERNVGHDGCRAWSAEGGTWAWWAGLNWRTPGYEQKDDHPVVCVSWNDVNRYAEWLSKQPGQKYRLPTEAEWEYAARAGTASARYWSEDPDQACPYADVADRTAKQSFSDWTIHNCTDGYVYTAPVGSFEPNAWKLYDMLGNVWEWTCSAYAKEYDGPERTCADKDTIGPLAVRGGSWYDLPAWVRSALRSRYTPSNRFSDLGFRLARSL